MSWSASSSVPAAHRPSLASPIRTAIEPAAAEPAPASGAADFDLVAIGASTGGIHALSALLRELPASCRVPILITQHLPASFIPYFAAQLQVLAGRPCDVAIDRLRVRPGRMIVAAGDAHMIGVRLPDGGTDQAAAAVTMPAKP